MADFAIIAGVAYEVEATGASVKRAQVRAFDHTLLQSSADWTFTVLGVRGTGARLTPAEYATLAAALDAASVAVSGNAFGAVTSVRGEITDAGFVRVSAGVQAYRPQVHCWEPD